jgi:hypothetical protein
MRSCRTFTVIPVDRFLRFPGRRLTRISGGNVALILDFRLEHWLKFPVYEQLILLRAS